MAESIAAFKGGDGANASEAFLSVFLFLALEDFEIPGGSRFWLERCRGTRNMKRESASCYSSKATIKPG